MQQHSQLEGLRQVACCSSGTEAFSRAEAELHGLSPHLPGHPQEVCPPLASPTRCSSFIALAALLVVFNLAHHWSFMGYCLTCLDPPKKHFIAPLIASPCILGVLVFPTALSVAFIPAASRPFLPTDYLHVSCCKCGVLMHAPSVVANQTLAVLEVTVSACCFNHTSHCLVC